MQLTQGEHHYGVYRGGNSKREVRGGMEDEWPWQGRDPGFLFASPHNNLHISARVCVPETRMHPHLPAPGRRGRRAEHLAPPHHCCRPRQRRHRSLAMPLALEPHSCLANERTVVPVEKKRWLPRSHRPYLIPTFLFCL
eukprot:1157416-Pelagomonas_calceolata.AAC.2